MTVLSAAQSAMARLVGRRPAAVVSSQNEMEVEITALAQEAAVDIMKGNDWQALTEFHTVTPDGTSSAYPFPTDYDRMIQASEIYDPETWCWGYRHILDYGEWLTHQAQGFVQSPGAWLIRGNQFHFSPTPPVGQTAVFPYISRNIFTSDNGTAKTEIENDTDSFVLDERLLTLSLVWRWKQMKGFDYAEDMRSYEMALSQAMTRDRGSRVIRRNSRHVPPNVRLGWPHELGPDYP